MNHFYSGSANNYLASNLLGNQCSENAFWLRFPYLYAFPPYFPSFEYSPSIFCQQPVIQHGESLNIPAAKLQHSPEMQNKEKKILTKQIKKMNSQELEGLKNKFIYKPINPSRKRVSYFDPTVAPALTGPSYYEIQKPRKDYQRNELMESINPQLMDELAYHEEQSFPFIIFRHRTAKKKYRKIFQDAFNKELEQDDGSKSQQENEEENISDYSRSDNQQIVEKQQENVDINYRELLVANSRERVRGEHSQIMIEIKQKGQEEKEREKATGGGVTNSLGIEGINNRML